MGGPDRLSRSGMAEAVAEVRGHNPGCIVRVSGASVPRPAPSPADISMDSSRLEGQVGFRMTPFKDALREIFALGGKEGGGGGAA
jgi:dTDP-4-dehydrorhamnose reductase